MWVKISSGLILLGLTATLLGCSNGKVQTANISESQPDLAQATASTPATPSSTQLQQTQQPQQLQQLQQPQQHVAKVLKTPEAQRSVELAKGDKPKVVDLWQPNEAQLARGDELILGLREEIKREPTLHEMEKRLQTHMGLSPSQAHKVILSLRLTQDRR